MRNDYIVIDADGHVNEDADGGHALGSHLDARFRSRVIRTGGDPRDRGQGGKYGKRHGDPAIHIEDMDVEGIDVAALYPTKLLAICKIEDHEYAVALCRAYNDWLADFCSYRPDRLKGVAVLPMVEPREAARELERSVTELGHIGGMAQPYAYNHKVADACYDDLYACAQQLDVPIAFHAGGESPSLPERFDTFIEAHTLGHTVEQMTAATLITYSGILERYPRLRVAFLEGLVGWVPMLAERMDEE
ncbi:MAG: amidohydrolase, partial [Chloroflexi bacterium]|nr:amidohydrolase [Chloroflexota bacterium]